VTLKGIWAAVLTPVDAGRTPDASRAIGYYRQLLERGCAGVNVLGTTGEAMSLGAAQRARFMEALATGGLPMDRVMAGTGAASLGDVIALTRVAFAAGFTAALVMPPFFYRDASDDGILAFFDALFESTEPPDRSVVLYNFPRMSGITFHPDLVDRLLEAFPETIAGMKDSSNDARLQAEILDRHPALRVFPGSELDLLAAKARGAAGSISGSVALWPELAHRVEATGDESQAAELRRRRAALDHAAGEGIPFVAAVRHLTATSRNDPVWERAMPPNVPLAPAQRRRLEALLNAYS
jgi:4-hydroxy-tetrahydrodipicolinate synthase